MKYLFVILLIAAVPAQARKTPAAIVVIDSGRDCSIRGMSIPANDVIWVSGSKGQVGRSVDGGKTWRWATVPGHEGTDFRDVHAFDSLTAVVMGIGDPAYILKTRDGGRSWNQVFLKTAPGMFLDAMDFRGREGICIGDPPDSPAGTRSFFVIRTKDGGDTWQEAPLQRRPRAQEGEAVFSASGSNIVLLDGKLLDYAFISGGRVSNLYLISAPGNPDTAYPLTIAKGPESSGAFSLATERGTRFYCAGGDYKAPGAATQVFTWTEDGGNHWTTPHGSAGPSGYRSCVRIVGGGRLVACGTNGVDICAAPGRWERISGQSFNVCGVSPDKRRIFFAGARGTIGVLDIRK